VLLDLAERQRIDFGRMSVRRREIGHLAYTSMAVVERDGAELVQFMQSLDQMNIEVAWEPANDASLERAILELNCRSDILASPSNASVRLTRGFSAKAQLRASLVAEAEDS
jgi:hypothetical protein